MTAPVPDFPRVSALSERARESLAVCGIYQRLGVEPDDIYFQPVRKDEDEWYPAVVAVLPSGKTPAWAIPTYGPAKTREELIAEWETAADLWNAMPLEDRKRWVDESRSIKAAVNFIASCSSLGIFFPDDARSGGGRKPD